MTISPHSYAYTHYLRSGAWRAVQAQIIEARGNRCEDCGRSGVWNRLTLHHKHYRHLGQEQRYPQDVVVLCDACHRVADETRAQQNFGLSHDYVRQVRRWQNMRRDADPDAEIYE